ncbi:MAG: Ig-like domain-containing protein [Oscillospiraceae bacterium]|nr:Ig-like domain-containing protein [Oscillospiraceae bacterium]
MKKKQQCLSAFLAFWFLLTLFPAWVFAVDAAEVPVAPIRQIVSGGYDWWSDSRDVIHYAVIDANGSLWIWGSNNYGQLGDGTTTDRSTPVKILDSVSSVSLGGYHSAAIRTDGTLWMWGRNSDGQLGDGTTTNRSTPMKIMDDVFSVSLGADHSAAICTDASMWAWGDNGYGELGDGTTTDRFKPVKIMEGVSSISLGEHYSAAILADGSLWTWGYNHYGRLGDGTTTDRSKSVKIMDGVSSVSSFGFHGAAVCTDNSLWGWGYNSNGEVGDGTTTHCSAPVKILDSVSSVSLGYSHSTAICTDGSLWMWGGTGETTCYSKVPMKVQDSVSAVSAGGVGGLYIAKDGSLWQYTMDGIPPSKTQIEIKSFSPGIYLNSESLELLTGNSATLTATIYPESDRDSAFVWASSNPDVAAVDNGTVTAKSAGEADITVMATKTGATAVCHVTVPAPLSLDRDALTLRVGETFQLTATVRRASGEETDIAWFSSAPSVATVSDDGTVSAVGGGTATVSVITVDGACKADCVITVPYEVSGVKLDRTSAALRPGDSMTLTATVIPAGAEERDVHWLSSAPGVATVSNGLVKAWSVGKTTITVATASGGFTATCVVYVDDSSWPYSILGVAEPESGSVGVEIANFSGVGASLMVCAYDGNGKMLRCAVADASRIAPGMSGTLKVAIPTDDAATIKTFLLDSDCRLVAPDAAKRLK